ncbi:MAG: N-acetyltransferase [Saprospiraceae bacterium]|nr:MAG: N-acetyltransferase [Saprospiraceae bacterium]
MLQFCFSPFPNLTTKRLQLRKTELSDANTLFLLHSNEKVIKYLDRPKRTEQEVVALTKSIIEDTDNNESIMWVILLKGHSEFIGNIGFWRIKKEHHRAEVGYILSPEHWNAGIMSEAMHAVLNYGFGVMKLHSVEANVNPDNTASIKVLKKQGFKQEAYFKEDYYFDGRYLDSAIYSLLCHDFITK